VKELDALCREVVFLRDGNKCRKCGKESGLFDWAHVHSRRSRVLRWNLLNSLVLCRACHMRWHDASPGAGDAMLKWWKAEVGPEVVTKLDLLKFTKPRKTDPELVRAYLEAERKKL
jgi:5-methylcytosine-specific restriction endonuclease McrA